MAEREKDIAVIVGDTVHDVVVRPGTTAADILADIGVGGDFWLANRNGQPFGADENIYAAVEDGGKLIATAPANVAGVVARKGV